MLHLPDVTDALTRGSAWLTLWDTMLADRMAPESLLGLAIGAVPVEASELNLQRMLHDVERLFWVFLPPARRAAYAPSLEDALRRRLDTASSVTMKAAAFGSLRSIATTSSGVAWIRSIWSGAMHVDGLPLGEADYVALAQELAVRAAEDDETIRCSSRGQRVATATTPWRSWRPRCPPIRPHAIASSIRFRTPRTGAVNRGLSRACAGSTTRSGRTLPNLHQAGVGPARRGEANWRHLPA